MSTPDDKGYIVEYRSVGNSVKVVAFDPVSLKEVSIVGARGVAQSELARLAIRKLEFMLEKDKKS